MGEPMDEITQKVTTALHTLQSQQRSLQYNALRSRSDGMLFGTQTLSQEELLVRAALGAPLLTERRRTWPTSWRGA